MNIEESETMKTLYKQNAYYGLEAKEEHLQNTVECLSTVESVNCRVYFHDSSS